MFVFLKNKICSLCSFCSNNKISITTVLTIFIVVILYYCSVSYKILKENTDFFSSLGSIATGISLIFVAIQVYYIKLENETRNKQLAQENAFEMAKLYATDILMKLHASNVYLESIGFIDKIRFLKDLEVKEFDKKEMDKLFGKEEIDSLIELYNKKVQSGIYEEALTIGYNLSKIDFYLKFYEFRTKSDNLSVKSVNELWIDDLRTRTNSMIDEVLNKLEYLCMYFNNNLAESDYVYPSLHQSFLEYIKSLYFFIAIRNDDPARKYYTEIIKLYNKWYNQEKNYRIDNNC